MAQSTKYSLSKQTRLLVLCLSVVVPLLGLSGFFLGETYKRFEGERESSLDVQAKLASRSIYEWLSCERQKAKAIAITMSTLKAGSLTHLMVQALNSNPGWKEILLVEPTGKLISYASKNELKLKPLKDLPLATVRQNLFTDQTKIVSYAASPLSNKPIVGISTPIYEGNRVKTILLTGIEPSTLLSLFHGLGEQPTITIIDANKRIIARTLGNEIWAGQDVSQATEYFRSKNLRINAVLPAEERNHSRKASIYALESVPDSDWLTIVNVAKGQTADTGQSWLLLAISLPLAALAIFMFLLLLNNWHFAENVNIITQEASAIGQGDLSRRVKVKASDQLVSLAQAFNKMAMKLEIDHEQKLLVERLAEAIRQSLDLQEILDTAVKELGKTLGASRCCLALFDDQRNEGDKSQQLIFDHVWYDSQLSGTALKNRSLVVTDNSILEMLLAQGAILSLDMLEEGKGPAPFFQKEHSVPDDWQSIKSLIACPIVANQSSKGLILIHQCNQFRVFSDSELELVQTIARHLSLAIEHARLYQRTKAMAEQQTLINHIVGSIRSSLDLNRILNTATEELAKALAASRCQIAQPTEDGPLVVSHEFHTEGLSKTEGISLYSEPLDFQPHINEGQIAPITSLVLGIDLKKVIDSLGNDEQTVKRGQTLKEAPLAIIDNTSLDTRCLPFRQFLDAVGSKSLIAAPLLSERRLIGLLMVHQCDRLRTWTANEIQLVQVIADQLAIAIMHAYLFAQVHHQAITDGLTGLYNHVYFKRRLTEEVRLADRKGMPCSLLMIDLDNLKYINDNFGHPVGDAAIRHVAQILKTLLRSGDTAARYGGEEFVVILPETSLLEAALIGNRLLTQIANAQVPGLGKITASMGAASYPRQAEDLDDLIGKADKALYCAKDAGRNQLWIYEEPGKPVPEFRVSKRFLAAKDRFSEKNH